MITIAEATTPVPLMCPKCRPKKQDLVELKVTTVKRRIMQGAQYACGHKKVWDFGYAPSAHEIEQENATIERRLYRATQ